VNSGFPSRLYRTLGKLNAQKKSKRHSVAYLVGAGKSQDLLQFSWTREGLWTPLAISSF